MGMRFTSAGDREAAGAAEAMAELYGRPGPYSPGQKIWFSSKTALGRKGVIQEIDHTGTLYVLDDADELHEIQPNQVHPF
jgi:hypothetical protein